MGRVETKCVGDCSKCELAKNPGHNVMICMLDQIFQRVQFLERAQVTTSEDVRNIKEFVESSGSIIRKLGSELLEPETELIEASVDENVEVSSETKNER